YTAAIYAARANLQPVLYEGVLRGGQLTTTTDIENFPGYPEGINGFQLMEDLRQQAARFGTQFRTGIVVESQLDTRPFVLTLDCGKKVKAETIIIATGATARYLGLPSEAAFKGRGVSACATCDGFFYRGKDVAIVGGGDTACEEALYLAALCRKVYMIVRRNVFRASKVMQERVLNTPNIEVLWEHQTKEVLGDETGVTGVRLVHKSGKERILELPGFFLAIGHHPNTEPFQPWIEVDKDGYIVTKGKTTETNIEGVFAAGDVQDPRYRQAVTAAGSGCMAAMDVERYLSMKSGL
ncbi:MAG: thioredoxin-disulfide reductase, partial [Bacteroidales bacterium]|nr:thioredoxin-disulfide reductase [Bacteroidales bacterium]